MKNLFTRCIVEDMVGVFTHAGSDAGKGSILGCICGSFKKYPHEPLKHTPSLPQVKKVEGQTTISNPHIHPHMSAAQSEQEKGRGATEAVDDGRYSGAAGVFESIDTEGSKCQWHK